MLLTYEGPRPIRRDTNDPVPLFSWRSTIGLWPIEQAHQGLIDKVQAPASSGRLHRLDILKYPEYPAKTPKYRAAVARFRAAVTRPRAGVARYRAVVTRFTLSVASISIPISINPAASSFSRRR